MALPITGPTDAYEVGPLEGGYPRYMRFRRRYKQVKPFNLPLPYRHSFSRVTVPYADGGDAYGGSNQWNKLDFNSGSSSWYYPYAVGGTEYLSNARVLEANNRARARFSSLVTERAEVLLSLVERTEAITMISKRSRQMIKFVSALRKFRFDDAAAALGVSRRKIREMTLRRSAHSFADNFLEFWFGWSPLVSDIGNAVEILEKPFRNKSVRASGSSSYTYRERVYTPSNGYSTYATEHILNYDDKARVVCQAEVRVTNPNLFLANQLGFTNPVATAWQAVPFSFVVDYFANVNQFLSQWTEFHGVDLINASYSTKLTRTCFVHGRTVKRANGSPSNGFQKYGYTSDHFERTLGIPSVTLRKKGFNLPVTRALSSISLLITLGIKKD